MYQLNKIDWEENRFKLGMLYDNNHKFFHLLEIEAMKLIHKNKSIVILRIQTIYLLIIIKIQTRMILELIDLDFWEIMPYKRDLVIRCLLQRMECVLFHQLYQTMMVRFQESLILAFLEITHWLIQIVQLGHQVSIIYG